MSEEKMKTISRTMGLLTDMVTALHDRGYQESHPLIQRAGELLPLLKAMAAEGSPEPASKEAAASLPLHLRTAETVACLDIQDALAQGLIVEPDLAEAAFTFENEFMALLGDDNTVPMDAYGGMSKQDLIRTIKGAVDNICRLRS